MPRGPWRSAWSTSWWPRTLSTTRRWPGRSAWSTNRRSCWPPPRPDLARAVRLPCMTYEESNAGLDVDGGPAPNPHATAEEVEAAPPDSTLPPRVGQDCEGETIQ